MSAIGTKEPIHVQDRCRPKRTVTEFDGSGRRRFSAEFAVVQKAQKRLFEGLVLLGLLDLVFSFGSILHRTMMPQASSVSVPVR
jgi:hypothetical protein